jgi:hypothetical protein
MNTRCAAIWIVLLAGCGPLADLRDKLEPDLSPPTLQAVRVHGESLELSFDEVPVCLPENIRVQPPLPLASLTVEDSRLGLSLPGQIPGQRYTVELTVADARGNSLSFAAELYGYNPSCPKLLINEFTPRGSSTHPDLVECKVLEPGDLAGVALYLGTPSSHDGRFVFPALEVRGGEFILVHCKPLGVPEEIDEIGAKDQSGGLDASADAYDFWMRGAAGMNGNNGAVSLFDRPGGSILDGVLYSNRSSSSDSQYRGFGSADSLERAEELAREGGWLLSGEAVRPEDAVNPEESTATRSLNRSSASQDTDRAADWHIVPTRGSTFGVENSDEVYVTGIP